MERSETIGELAKALAKAQAAMTAAAKDDDNPHFRSKYAGLPSIWQAARKPLTDNGLSVIQMPGEIEDGRLTLTTMLLHESGEFISSTASTRLTKDDPQGVGSATTYLRRYALAAMVGIVADDDDDGNAASGISTQRQQPQNTARNNPQHAAGQIDLSDAAAHVLNFGKYKGLTFGEIAERDQHYLAWLAENARYQDDRDRAAAMLASPEAF